MFFYIAITSLLGLAVSLPVDEIAVPNYGFNYAVRDPGTGDNKAQTETRDGGVVKGSYSLQEPDGTLRVVDYYADPIHGFNAVVRRDGPSGLHPAPHSSPAAMAPMYHASMHPTRQQIGGHAASIVPVGPVSIDSIPSYAGLVGLGGYAHSSLGASHGLSTGYGHSTSVGHGMLGARYGH